MAKQDFIDWVERQGQSLRRKLALSPTQRLDPYKLAGVMRVVVITPHDIVGLPATSIEELLGLASDGWSAGSLRTPDGRFFVVMNSNHAMTRCYSPNNVANFAQWSLIRLDLAVFEKQH